MGNLIIRLVFVLVVMFLVGMLLAGCGGDREEEVVVIDVGTLFMARDTAQTDSIPIKNSDDEK